MTRADAIPIVLTALLALFGCVDDARYPSLARRPQELVGGGVASAASDAVSALPDDGNASGRTGTLLAQARAAHRAFAAQSAAAARAVSRAGARGGDSWAQASVAVAGAEARLAAVSSALAELDTLAADRRAALAGGSDAGVAAIAAAQDEVSGYAQADGATLRAWTTRLGG